MSIHDRRPSDRPRVLAIPQRPILCSIPLCARDAYKTYVDTDDLERGFCLLADHAFGTMQLYPPRPLGDELRAAHRSEAFA